MALHAGDLRPAENRLTAGRIPLCNDLGRDLHDLLLRGGRRVGRDAGGFGERVGDGRLGAAGGVHVPQKHFRHVGRRRPGRKRRGELRRAVSPVEQGVEYLRRQLFCRGGRRRGDCGEHFRHPRGGGGCVEPGQRRDREQPHRLRPIGRAERFDRGLRLGCAERGEREDRLPLLLAAGLLAGGERLERRDHRAVAPGRRELDRRDLEAAIGALQQWPQGVETAGGLDAPLDCRLHEARADRSPLAAGNLLRLEKLGEEPAEFLGAAALQEHIDGVAHAVFRQPAALNERHQRPGRARRAAGRHRRHPPRERLHRLTENIREVVVLRHHERLDRDVDRLLIAEEAQGPHRLKPDERMLVGDEFPQPAENVARPVTPEREHAGGRRAGLRLWRREDPVEQRFVDDVLPLMHPERFDEVVLGVGVLRVERGQPLLERGNHLGGRAGPQFGPGPISRAILIDLERVEHRLGRLAGDLRRHDERPALRLHPPDPPVEVVTIWVAQRMLHVADERVVPVDHVEAAVGPKLEIDGAEVGVVRLEQRVDRIGREPRAIVPHLVLQDALEADAVVEQVVALGIVGKLAAADELTARGRPPLHLQELFQTAVLLRIVDIPGEGGAEVVGAARGVGHEILSPAVERLAPGIREAVRHEDVELLPPAVVAEDAGIGAPLRAADRLHRRLVKRPLLHEQPAGRIAREGADRVVRIGRIESVEHDLADVGLVVTVGIFQENEVRLLRDIEPAIGDLEAGRQMEAVGEHRLFVGLSVAVGVFEDQDLVVDRHAGEVLRVAGHRGDPEPALSVERHLHRVREIGKLDLRGEAIHLVALLDLHLRQRLLRRGRGGGRLRVGLDREQVAGARIVDRIGHGFSLGHVPDPPVADGRHRPEFLELRGKVHRAVGILAATVNVAAVDRTMVVEELQVFLVHGGEEFSEVDRGRGRPRSKEGLVEDPAHLPVAMLVHMDAVDRPELCRLRHLVAAGREEIDEESPLAGGHLPHGLGVEGDAGVVLRAIGQAGPLQVFMCERGDEDDLANRLLAPAGVVLTGGSVPVAAGRSVAVDGVRILYKCREILFELRDTGGPGE